MLTLLDCVRSVMSFVKISMEILHFQQENIHYTECIVLLMCILVVCIVFNYGMIHPP